MVSMNTYKFSKNDFFVFLGTGYVYVGILDIFHAFAYGSMNIIPGASFNMVSKFWLMARFFEAATLLLSNLFLYKKVNHQKLSVVQIIYFFVFVLLMHDIMYFNIMPTCWNQGQTTFKLAMEYLITTLLIACLLIFFKARKLMDHNLFLYLESSLFLKIIYEICISFYTFNTDTIFALGHIIKVLSFFLMYKGIIENGLNRPFDVLAFSLDREENYSKYIEEAIIKNERCYDLIIDRSGDGIVIYKNDKIVYANSTFAKNIGADDFSCIVGRSIWDIVHGDKENLRNIDNIDLNTPFNGIKLFNLDGSEIEGNCSFNQILYRGEPAVMIIFRGISSQVKISSLKNDIMESEKKLEKSNEYNSMLTEFFTNISHELKTPLNIILGTIQLLEIPVKEKLPSLCEDRKNRYLKIMKQNTFRLIRLINNLIDISKYDSKYLNLDMHNHDIVRITEDIAVSVSDNFKSKGVNIIFDTDIEEKIMAVDEDKLERILLNLLSNAVKFTDNGGEIMVNVEDHEDFVRISVKDTGIGIPKDKLDIIFDRFGQVDKSFTRNREGSGIGLSLVKTLVDMHGGKIMVNSTVGEGSKFIIDLPVLILEEKKINDAIFYDSKIDKINIEFSDIYSMES
jgi:PAS domain S-box-containing protein